MYDFISKTYNESSEWEQLKDLPGTSDYPRAQITKNIFREYLGARQEKTSVLEIGPGSGFITEHIAQCLPADGSCSLDLMDFSSGFLSNTSSKNYRVRNYICYDVTKYQEVYQGERYDFIFFQEVLEHLISPFTALVNINQMLADNGVVFLTIPNSGWWRNLYVENLRLHKILVPKVLLDTHIGEISTIGAIKLVTMAGFDVLKVEYYCSRFPVLKSITSEQVGLLLIKRDSPAARWEELTVKLRLQNQRALRERRSIGCK